MRLKFDNNFARKFLEILPKALADFRLEQFPVTSLPPSVSGFTAKLAESLQVCPELVAHGVIGALSAACLGKVRLKISEGHHEPLTIYSVSCLSPGERKSPVIQRCKFPIEEWERNQFLQGKNEREMVAAERDAQLQVIKKKKCELDKQEDIERIKELQAQLKELHHQLPDTPPIPRILADDVTPEALAKLLFEQGERIAIIEAEGGLFDLLGGRYNQGKSNLDLVLKAYSGEQTRIDRKSNDPILLRYPLVSLCLAVQPQVLDDLGAKKDFVGRGLVPRFLFFWPDEKAGSRLHAPSPMPSEFHEEYNAAIARLLKLQAPDSEVGGNSPLTLTLDPEAYKLLEEFRVGIERRMASGQDLAKLRDWANKHPGRTARLAGLFHMLEPDSFANHVISAKTMSRAIDIGKAMIPRAIYTYRRLGLFKDYSCAWCILDYAKKHGKEVFGHSECFTALRESVRNADAYNAALDLLCERGYLLRSLPEPPGGRGRPKKPGYMVHPSILKKNGLTSR